MQSNYGRCGINQAAPRVLPDHLVALVDDIKNFFAHAAKVTPMAHEDEVKCAQSRRGRDPHYRAKRTIRSIKQRKTINGGRRFSIALKCNSYKYCLPDIIPGMLII
jgi:hypothetical protein